MDIQYEFNIKSLKRKITLNSYNDVVIECEYNLNITTSDDPENVHTVGGLTTFDVSQLDSNSFIPFENINKETIISWILKKENVSSLSETYFVKSELAYFKQMYEENNSQVESSVNDWKVTNTLNIESISSVMPPYPTENIDTVGITTDYYPVG